MNRFPDFYAEVPCPLCGSGELLLYVWAPSHYGPEKYSISKCSKCGFLFTNPQDTTYYLRIQERGLLSRHLSEDAISRGTRLALVQLEMLSRYTQGRRVLDFGCGSGIFVRAALQAGWGAIGHDLNAGQVEASNMHWGFDVLKTGPFEEFAERHPGPYDVIIANQVFEHLQQPVNMGQQLIKLVKPGGLIHIEVPNARRPKEWLNRGITFDPTSHWCHFSTRTIQLLIQKIGCEVVFVSAAPALMSVWQKLGLKHSGSKLAALCRRVLPPFGRCVCAIGRKP